MVAEVRKCLNCGNVLEGDYRKKFCSNKGWGNCKDAYHNRRRSVNHKQEVNVKDSKITRRRARCLHCGKKLKGDVRKRFCSNKGRGNCKDKYHNQIKFKEGRISDARAQYLGYWDKQDYLEHGWNRDEDLYDYCWDNHKDW